MSASIALPSLPSRLFVIPLVALALTLSGCTQVRERAAEVREQLRKLRGDRPAPPPPAPPVATVPAPAPAPGQAPAPAPTAARALNVSASCSGRDETGYAENIQVAVANGRVSRLDARVDVPRRGACSFRLPDFRQTRETPHVELVATSGSRCVVRMWEQGTRVTVAATDCEEKCAIRSTFEYVWPFELNSQTGACG